MDEDDLFANFTNSPKKELKHSFIGKKRNASDRKSSNSNSLKKENINEFETNNLNDDKEESKKIEINTENKNLNNQTENTNISNIDEDINEKNSDEYIKNQITRVYPEIYEEINSLKNKN